ncbi:N-acetylmuramoyl-L-alanine amidase [Thermopolyspora sp. NPDC052614]|uniref:N-acetylmuramoyl-L-alanine amidase n=1 Tax=Thermopolyspora sp. NPDC052614 TaxID=3155682 RepID=UPI00342192C2
MKRTEGGSRARWCATAAIGIVLATLPVAAQPAGSAVSAVSGISEGVSGGGSTSAVAAGAPVTGFERQRAFEDAAAEFGVPVEVLLAVAYHESRWEHHRGLPSVAGGYGPMHLVDADLSATRGEGFAHAQTAHTAARLAGLSAKQVVADDRANIRAGAALLASYARALHGGTAPADPAAWYGAVARWAATPYETDALRFADDVYRTIRNGARRTTDDGQRIHLPAHPAVTPDTGRLRALRLRPPARRRAAQCPPGMNCGVIDTAYHRFDADDPANFCNYASARRPEDSYIRFIVLHDTETPYRRTRALPRSPRYCASWHYLVRSRDGHVDQALDVRHVAWHAGNWWVNSHSIGIEQEGWASRGGRWFTERMYRSTARLVRYLADRYDIPLDRGHILGHDNVPADSGRGVKGMHHDPGPYWNWAHFMELVGAPLRATAPPDSDLVTIRPSFRRNRLVFSGCVPKNEPIDGGKCGDAPPRPSSAVLLRTAPRDDAPLVGDPYLHPDGGPGSLGYGDWGARASTGQRFVVADREGDWVAIWYGGRPAWLKNPADNPVLLPARGAYVTPRPGLDAAAVYGRPFPEPDELPADVAHWTWGRGRQPGPYDRYAIPAGQAYALIDTFEADVYYAAHHDASAPGDRELYTGSRTFHLIHFNHRYAFVDADDVEVYEIG